MSLAVVTGLSAAVGVVIARKIGRGVETDGFFAAYGVFLVLVLAASAVRAAVLPKLARARAEGAFGSLFASYALAISVVAAPALALALFATDWSARQLAAGLPPNAQSVAADALVFLVPAAVLHLFAALCGQRARRARQLRHGRGRLRARERPRARADPLAHRRGRDRRLRLGNALNGAVTLAVPLVALVLRAEWGSSARLPVLARLGELARASALAIVLQAFFVICLRFASGLGTGAVTSFTYAYFVAAALVSVTATSLGVVSSVPLTRAALSAARADPARDQHVARLVRRGRGRGRGVRARRRRPHPRWRSALPTRGTPAARSGA